MADVPSNTHLPVEMLLSYRDADERTGWAYVYTLLRAGTDIASVKAKMPDFIDKYTQPEDAQGVSFAFQALPDIHLDSDLAREIVPNGSRFYVRVFTAVGAFYPTYCPAQLREPEQCLGVGPVAGGGRPNRIRGPPPATDDPRVGRIRWV